MSTEPRTVVTLSVEERLDRLYAELADLKRQVILGWPEPTSLQEPPLLEPSDAAGWQDLLAAVEDVSALWVGPGAVEETRTQRGS